MPKHSIRAAFAAALKAFAAIVLAAGLLPAAAFASDGTESPSGTPLTGEAAIESPAVHLQADEESTGNDPDLEGEGAPPSDVEEGSGGAEEPDAPSEGEGGSGGGQEEPGTSAEANPADWEFSANADGTLVVTGYVGVGSEAVVPAEVDGKAVTGIRFDNPPLLSNLRSLELPASIEMIGDQAFAGMANLEEVVIAEGSRLRTIGEGAFERSSIVSFTMPESLETIQPGAFRDCPNLESITFNDGLDPFVHARAAADGSDSPAYDEPYGIASYSNVDFVVPETSENFRATSDGALLSKDGSILYERSSKYADGAYAVPESVTEIGAEAFVGQTGLTSIALPEGLEAIHEAAFAYAGIRSIVIPDSVTDVRGRICLDCPELRSVVVGTGVKALGAAGAGECFYSCDKLSSVVLGESIESIGEACFAETALASIDIPESVREVGDEAFGDNLRLTQVTGCEGLESIGRFAFANAKLATFPFGERLEFVSGSAFEGCASFSSDYPEYLERNADGDWMPASTPETELSLILDGTELYSNAEAVLDIVNDERAARGLQPLTMDADLADAAMQRAAETAIAFTHTRPDGSSCFTVSSKAQGENIAAGSTTPATVMSAWMNSEDHRSNILDPSWRSVGIGCFQSEDGALYWVQLFGSGTPLPADDLSDREASRTVAVSPESCQIRFVAETTAQDHQGEWACLDPGEALSFAIRATNTGFVDVTVSPKSFAWASSDALTASVSAEGVVRATDEGACLITGTWGDETIEQRVLSGCTPNAVYTDVDGHWGEGWVMAATQRGLMSGHVDASGPTGLFAPDESITRAQLAVILYRHANPDSTATTDPDAYEDDATGMSDTFDRQYYTAATNWAWREGIMTGDRDPSTDEPLLTMRPGDPVSRQEAATMIARYAALYGIDAAASASVFADAPDADEVMPFAAEAVAWCYENGIMTGDANTRELSPGDPATRAAMAKIAVVGIETIEAELGE